MSQKTPLSQQIIKTSSALQITLIIGIVALSILKFHNYTQQKSLSSKLHSIQDQRAKLNTQTLAIEQQILEIKAYKLLNQKTQINSMQKNSNFHFFQTRQDRLSFLKN